MRRSTLSWSLLAVLVITAAAQASLQHDDYGPTDPRSPLLNQGPKEAAVGERAMVSSQLASSTLAAVKVLEGGGNAVDAALTALFVQQVHDYHMVFLFGSVSALYYEASSDRIYALNAVAARPEADPEVPGDPSKVAIGGTVRGAAALAERFGNRPWSSILEPAIAAAEEGAIVTSFMYGLNYALWEFGYLGDLRGNSAAREFYMPDGHLVGVGHRWPMPALAETLRRIAEEGPDHMYTGEWGQKFVDAARAAGGQVSLEDLAEYEPRWSEPTRFSYRGEEIVGSPPPDTGGLVVGANLNVLENFDLPGTGHFTESPETLATMVRAFARVQEETSGAIRDPLSYRIPRELWLSEDWGRTVARFVRETSPKVDLAPAESESEERETGKGALRDVSRTTATTASIDGSAGSLPTPAELGSDHIVIADQEGNWLSLLHTVHGGAPGVFIDGVRATGSGAPADTRGPGRRLVLPITAIMVLADGRPRLAMGTPGNPPQPVTEVLVDMIDFGMDPKSAAEAPRFWAADDGHGVRIESRIADAVRRGLASRGIEIHDLGEFDFHTGSMQIVWRDPETGRLHGATDPRRLGHAAGF